MPLMVLVLVGSLCAADTQDEVSGAEIRKLLKLADEKDGEARREALHSLVGSVLKNVCRDKDALEEVARAVPRHLRDLAALTHSETRLFLSVVLSKVSAGTTEELFRGLQPLAEDKDAHLSRTAWHAIAELVPLLKGKTAEGIARRMIACLNDAAAAAMHETAISILGHAAPNLKDDVLAQAIASIEKVMQDTASPLRLSAAWVLAIVAGPAVQESAVDALAAYLEGGGIRQLEASLAFQAAGPRLRGGAAWKAADALAKRLRDKSIAIRNNCGLALIGIVPALDLQQIKDLRPRVPDPSDETDEHLRAGLKDLQRALEQREDDLRKQKER